MWDGWCLSLTGDPHKGVTDGRDCPVSDVRRAAAAMDFLADAFGFREVVRSLAPDDGRVWHAQMELDSARIYLGQPVEYRNPNHLGGVTVSVHVYVDDVDAHYKRARSAGAAIKAELDDRDYGERRYHAVDPEGHVWVFST